MSGLQLPAEMSMGAQVVSATTAGLQNPKTNERVDMGAEYAMSGLDPVSMAATKMGVSSDEIKTGTTALRLVAGQDHAATREAGLHRHVEGHSDVESTQGPATTAIALNRLGKDGPGIG